MNVEGRKLIKPVEVSKETLEFHRDCLVVDLHTDSMNGAALMRLDIAKRHKPPYGVLTPWMLHADIPKLKEGGVDAVFFGIVAFPLIPRPYRWGSRIIRFAKRTIEEHPDTFQLALTPEDIESAHAAGKIAALLCVEGMHILSGELDNIVNLYNEGVRYITMAHFHNSRFAISSADVFKRRASLGIPGLEAVKLMNELGMMIDVTHTHTDLIDEIARRSKQPIIASHAATRGVSPIFRNLSDRDIKDIASTGGVIGLMYAAEWLTKGPRTPHLEVVVDHADYIKKLVGSEYLALGSDWDGLVKTPDGMRDASDLPALIQLFFDRGYSEDEVRGILGLNFMRVFKEVSSNRS